MRLERWLHDWDVLLVILAVGLLTGLAVFMAADTHPDACRQAVNHMHVPIRSFTWVCSHP